MLYRLFGVSVGYSVRYACSGFLEFHSVIVAVGMNICRLIVRPADTKIKAGTEERKKDKIQNRKNHRSGREKRPGNGSRKVLKSLYLGA
jgi:hypothetical protein